MRIPTRQAQGFAEPLGNANEAFKARSQTRLYRAIMLAAAAHLLLFLASPDWIKSSAEAGATSGHPGLEVVALGDLPAPGPEGQAGGLLTVTPTEDGDEGEPEDEGERSDEGPDLVPDPVQGGGGGFGAGVGSQGDLERLAALRPALAEPEPAPEDTPDDEVEDGVRNADGAGADEDGTARIREHASEMDYERLSREEILDLERLSALRPELSFTAPSNWILVRNPREVGDFLEARFGQAEANQRPRGSFSVALWIDERGSVEWAEINRSSGEPELDHSALELFREVVAFAPAREDGLRVPTAVIFWLSYW
jgi:TonB family protein